MKLNSAVSPTSQQANEVPAYLQTPFLPAVAECASSQYNRRRDAPWHRAEPVAETGEVGKPLMCHFVTGSSTLREAYCRAEAEDGGYILN